jgi:hypothetical protein
MGGPDRSAPEMKILCHQRVENIQLTINPKIMLWKDRCGTNVDFIFFTVHFRVRFLSRVRA